MPRPLKILIAEDNPNDAELLLRQLRQAGYDPVGPRVDSESDYMRELSGTLDLVLSDYQMPQFSGLRALELLKQRELDVPFIIVSGTIGEETAVDAMRQGAADYLLKDRLGRLGSAVGRALEEGRLRRERRETLEALRRSEERFRQVVENIHEVFWLSDAEENRIVYVSPGYEAVWGQKFHALNSSSGAWFESVHPGDQERVLDAAAARQSSGGYDETYRIIRPDGTIRWIRDRAFPIKEANGRVRRIVGVAEDITERRQLEDQFLHAQRMEAIGTLASGVAHDLNNILAPMLMVAGLLKEKASSDKDREMLSIIERSGQRGAGIIRQLLAFSRGTPGEKMTLQPRHLVHEMADVMRETFPRNITIVEAVAPDLWTVEANPTQLHQVIMNLCVNARDAMPEGGTLTLEATNLQVPTGTESVDSALVPGTYLLVSVKDTGHGISPGILGKIFEPFFTTKEIGKGTGLGLSTVVGITKGHGGTVKVDSQLGQGTTFRVYLPAAMEIEITGESAPSARTTRGHGELILVVDDEAPIRDAARSFLELHGYQALVANSGEEAIKTFIEHQGTVRLVITDIMMPGMGGLALLKALKLLEPSIRTIATSGLDQAHNLKEFAVLAVSEVLPKPFASAQFLAAVDAALSPSEPFYPNTFA